ncbi:uncharacterized protein cd44a [Salminus brasiliensis]|uniref:uncharacterized protein cd44a n=1 Tax=Salminus brasiliensis TaxID=930266 RepID=UPI003B83A1D6
MQTDLLVLVMSGLVLLRSTWSQAVQTGRCSYAGVVHLEGSGPYSLNYQQAMQLCQNLGYSLATEEQLTKAYNQGLKTCRNGWIEGQKTSFIPNDVDPKCTVSTTGITSHVQEEDNLSDVYCFTYADSSEISCEDAANPTPAPVSSQTTHSELNTTIANPEEDVLDEVIADGFIVDIKETTPSVKKERSEDITNTATTPNPGGNPSESSQGDIITTVIVPKDPEVTTEEPKNENADTSPTIIPDQDTTEFPKENSEGTTAKIASTDLEITKHDTSEKLTAEETIKEFMNRNMEGSGMSPETLIEKTPEDLVTASSINTPVEDLRSTTRLLWFSKAVDGSGMEPEGTTSIKPTSKGTPKPNIIIEMEEPGVTDNKSSEVEVEEVANIETRAEAPKERNNMPDPDPTASALAEEGTPGWLIIFAFCMTLGAILCIFAGIATKDKWYGPSRRSVNSTPTETNEDYGKAATLPLSDKEQELMTLMNGEPKNDKDFTVISLEEAPEKEYLM